MSDAPRSGEPDLDTLIRQAEQAVIDSDRRWQHNAQSLGPALRGSAGKAAWAGAAGLAALVVGWFLLRRFGPRKARHAPVIPSRSRHAVVQPDRAVGWRRVSEFGGALVGSAVRSGLAPVGGKSGLPLLLNLGWPWLTRWWHARHDAPPPP